VRAVGMETLPNEVIDLRRARASERLTIPRARQTRLEKQIPAPRATQSSTLVAASHSDSFRELYNGSWVVYAHVAIPPESPQAIEHLRNQDLSRDEWPERRLAMESTLYNP
jgi:hypothetical protein